MSPRERKPADPRHGHFRTLLEAYWRDERNDLVPELPWGAAEAGALAAFLRANPKLSSSGFERLLRNRLASEDHAPGESPKLWLGSITRYASGPLDRFKLPKAQASTEAVLGMLQRQTEDDGSAALNYWRIVRNSNPAKYDREAPARIKAALTAEVTG